MLQKTRSKTGRNLPLAELLARTLVTFALLLSFTHSHQPQWDKLAEDGASSTASSFDKYCAAKTGSDLICLSCLVQRDLVSEARLSRPFMPGSRAEIAGPYNYLPKPGPFGAFRILSDRAPPLS